MLQPIHIIAASHIGQREENQDNYIVLNDTQTHEYLLVVADGMGGHEGGAIAASKVIDTCTHVWEQKKGVISDIDLFLNKLIRSCHAAVNDIHQGEFREAQSAMSALYLSASRFVSVHVGDCRVIQIDKQQVVKRTIDQSLAQLHVLNGNITEEALATHPDQNKLYSSIGAMEAPTPVITQFEGGDCFVVCSDGFWELFPQDSLWQTVSNIETETALQRLLNEKIAPLSQHDNTTVIVVKVTPSSFPTAEHQRVKTLKHTPIAKKSHAPKWLMLSGVFLLALAIALTVIDSSSSTTKSQESSSSNEKQIEPDEKSGPESTSSTSRSSESSPTESLPTAPEPSTSSPSSEQNNNGKLSKETVGELNVGRFETRIPTVRKETDIAVENLEDAVNKIDELLRKSGLLGQNDTLEVTKEPKKLGSSEIIKLQQKYKGIPVYGAQTLSIVREGKLAKVDSKTVEGINVDVTPLLTVEQALAEAEKESKETLRLLNKATLILFKKGEQVLLSWWVNVERENAEHQTLIIDASNGLIIETISLFTSDNDLTGDSEISRDGGEDDQ